jgi:hypothetical protein
MQSSSSWTAASLLAMQTATMTQSCGRRTRSATALTTKMMSVLMHATSFGACLAGSPPAVASLLLDQHVASMTKLQHSSSCCCCACSACCDGACASSSSSDCAPCAALVFVMVAAAVVVLACSVLRAMLVFVLAGSSSSDAYAARTR